MNSVIPYANALPAQAEGQFRPIEPEAPSIRQLLGVLLSRAGLGLTVGLIAFAAVLLYAAQSTPQYFAAGSVMIEPKRENLAKVENQQPGALPPDTSAIDTQVEVLRSSALAEAVVRKLKLYEDPEFRPRGAGLLSRLLGTESQADAITRTTDLVQRRARIRRIGLTYVVQVGFVSASPKKAQQIANTFIETYMETQLQNKKEAVNRANTELSTNVEALRKEAANAEAALQQYKNAHGLLSAQGATMAEMEVSTLNTQIAAAKADAAEKRARLNAALAQVQRGGGGADVGAALGSNTIKELRTREAETSLKLAQLQARFTDQYPEVQRTQAELNDIRRQIQLELNRILSSLRAEAQAADQRQASLLGSRTQAQGGLAANNQAQVGLVVLQQRADAAKQIYEGYLNRAKELAVEASLQQPDASISAPATLPTRPFSPNLKLAAAFGALVGLVAAAFAILVAELWDRRLRSRGDVERKLGVSFAGVLPDFGSIGNFKLRTNPAGPADHLVKHPFTSFAEAFRNLGAFLRLSDRGAGAKVIALTSAVPREGKSMSSYCLARTMALAGSRVVLVDCDLRQRGVSKLIGNPDVGIVEVCDGDVALDDALVCDAKTGAWILPASGKHLPHDLFSKAEADELFRTLAERFDYVIVDTPPILGVADARILCAKADRVLYIAQWNKTPIRAAQSAMDILQECGANVAGALLSKVNVKQQARYGYGDSSDYFQYYRDYYVSAA